MSAPAGQTPPGGALPGDTPPGAPTRLRRELGTFGAVGLGLGSILGTGVFVSLGLAAGAAGPAVVLAVVLAALLAAANGLSSAQLAAAFPVSGGTYEYGYRTLGSYAGFTAGWMFLCAKSASAATAALGFAGYGLNALESAGWAAAGQYRVPVAVATALVFTALVSGGVRRSTRTNFALVGVALAALVFFVVAGAPLALARAGESFTPFFAGSSGRGPVSGLLYATALTFVAYTGYGRIATLGEEVREPRRTIPRAIVSTLLVTVVVYVAVAAVGVGVGGAGTYAAATRGEAAPLEVLAASFAGEGGAWLVAAGALTAMLGVLLNLLLGLSRVLLAMGRRGDAPAALARVDESASTPRRAVWVVGFAVAALALVGSVETTWSFSAFTVLVYYALTNLAALRLPPERRLFPRWIPVFGLVGCLFVAFWVEPRVWAAGLGLIAAGLLWHAFARRGGSGKGKRSQVDSGPP
ncbi:MAG TPA: APC family permease [Thermoanaerobaculia bacterium]|nr:APC family permease [Thermoanaerobaculia bacterium]